MLGVAVCGQAFSERHSFHISSLWCSSKRQICWHAKLQIAKNTFMKNQNIISGLKPSDLLKASQEETRCVPFSNPGVQALRKHITAVLARVPGTDESCTSIWGKIWGSTVMFNLPSIWTTINFSDTHDPVAQVFTGEEIDLDAFNTAAGPSSMNRGINQYFTLPPLVRVDSARTLRLARTVRGHHSDTTQTLGLARTL